jgi:hypothetical protein
MVAVRITDAYLHVCLDGSEPPLSVYVGDPGSAHQDDEPGTIHVDRDISMSGDYLSKKPGATLDLPTLALLLVLVLFLVPRLRTWLPAHLPPVPLRRFRAPGPPPSRGPPRPA